MPQKLDYRKRAAVFKALQELIPQGYHVFPQINLATFIERTDNAAYRNELFRNVDFW